MAHKIEIVYYNLWGDKFHHMVDMYIKMPLSNERYIDAVSVEANNKLFLECYNDECNNKGFNHCDMWLRGMLADYVKRCSLNDGDAPYYRHYYVDWLRNTRWISRNNPELQKWCNDYESWLNDNVFEKVAKDCSKDAIKELQNAFVGFYMYFDHAANVSPIPPDRNRDEVTTQLFNVLEWCKQHDNELKTQLVNRPLLKDVENLCILATHICESFDNWSSIIGNDAVTLELFNGVADILDNVIVPTIEQRNPTSKQPEPTPEPQPTPLVEATTKDDAPDFSHMESHAPTNPFDMSTLYYFLIDEGVIKNINEKFFKDCITHAHMNVLWGISGRLRKHNQMRCVFNLLHTHHYKRDWIECVAKNLGTIPKRIYNPTRETLGDFEKRLREII
jgi:hypothetical protein